MSRVDEAQEILRAFDFDRRRTNETAARTLLALAGMDERTTWAEATNERMGVRAILDWMRGPLRHPIAENSRETIRRFVVTVGGLVAKYRAARDLVRIPVTTSEGEVFTLSTGGQNELIKAMVEDFCAYFVPGGEVLYVGDADSKLMTFEQKRFSRPERYATVSRRPGMGDRGLGGL